MKLLKQLGFLRLNSPAERPLEEDGRVLHLFRSRAELKKAHGQLQDEIHRLKDRVKQQEGATARVQEALDALQVRLADPALAFSEVVFFQLRSLWTAGRDLIRKFVAELGEQQEERERKQFLAEFNRRQFSRRQAIEARLREAEALAADTREKLARLEGARSRATRWWHYFRRRELERRIHAMRVEANATALTLDDARAEFTALEAETPGEFPGLSLEARRAINLAAIAYAEVLCQRLAHTPLVALAREASARRECSRSYGDEQASTALMAEIVRGKALVQPTPAVLDDIKARTERLRATARYRNALDVVPVEDSVRSGQLEAVIEGKPANGAIDVLTEDLWDIYRSMMR